MEVAVAIETNLKLKKNEYFKWDGDMVQHLINSVLEYRRLMA